MKRKLLIGISIIFFSILLYFVFIPAPIKVDTVKVTRGTFQNILKVDGILRSKDRYIVSAFGDGDIKRVSLKVGDEVKKGDALAELFWEIKYTPVRSPISGVISKIFRESAGPIRRGDPIVEVVNPDNLEIMIELLTTDAAMVEVGDPVLGDGWGSEGVIRGRVVRISKAGFIKSSALGVEEEKTEVIADIKETPSDILKKVGSNFHLDVKVEIDKVENALKIPIGALFRSGKNWAVYIVNNNKASETTVQIKSKGNDEAMIERGLEENDEVIVFPGDLVKNGTRVKGSL